MSAIRFHGVSKSRGSERRSVLILRDISFSVERGEVVLLVGPSGSGKTTLLGLSAGLLTADGGAIEIRGVRMDGAGPSARRELRARSIGMVFQRPSLLSGLTVAENVLVMAAAAGLTAGEARARCGTLLDRLGIGSLIHRLPRELSGGEEQRVGIARALVHRPAVILADEPTASLDGVTGSSIAGILAELARERGTAILIATHDLRLRRFASRSLHLADGVISEEERVSG
jgi:putative ABC transport system ATP-binding protein